MINPRSTAFRVGSSVSGSSKGVQTCLTAPRLHNNSSSSRRGAQTARIRVDCHAAKRSQETILAAEDLDFDHLAVATDRTTDLGAAFRGGTGGGGGWQNDEYQLNYGRAVRTLRADLPHLLDRPLEPSIYTENLVFTSPWARWTSKGQYMTAAGALRAVLRVMMRSTQVDLTRLWSPEDGLLRARLHVTMTPWLGGPKEVDMLFSYKFNSKGLINEHVVEAVVPPEPPAAKVPVLGRAKVQQAAPLFPGPSFQNQVPGSTPPSVPDQVQWPL